MALVTWLLLASTLQRASAVSGENLAPAVYNWKVIQSVASPDGYPRSIVAVKDLAFKSTTLVDETNVYNDVETWRNRDGIEYYDLPGPEIRVKVGQRVIINVENDLHGSEVAMHWHGIHMKDQAWHDGTPGVNGCAIRPDGGHITYDFVITQGPGTHWWHSHAGTQYVDGVFGAFIIEDDEDPIHAAYPVPRDLDQALLIMDWAHENHHDVATRYTTRIGSYIQQSVQHLQEGKEVDVPFLPDYPWPTRFVLLNGHGQADCITRNWLDCQVVRLLGWDFWYKHIATSEQQYSRDETLKLINQWVKDDGRGTEAKLGDISTGQIGQCVPERDSFFGQCKKDAQPATLHCRKGKNARFRLINSGYSMPLRFWIDRHPMTVVSRDGNPAGPFGPVRGIVVAVGQRIDVIVKCHDRDDGKYKVFAQTALREFYPGVRPRHGNYEARSYAVLEYDDNVKHQPFHGCKEKDVNCEEPEISPEDFIREGDMEAQGTGFTVTDNTLVKPFRNFYSDWQSGGVKTNEFVPYVIETAMEVRNHDGESLNQMAPPADQQVFMSYSGAGNWWSSIATAHENIGKHYEWWTLNEGEHWTNDHTPLFAPTQPIMVGNLFGKSVEQIYTDLTGSNNPAKWPYVQKLLYDKASPKVYELVMVSWDVQQHPWHLHGYSVQVIGFGWLDANALWKNRKFDANQVGFADVKNKHTEPAKILAEVDTWTMAPKSWVRFRLKANNPGAWLLHCHMDYHLAMGMGFLVSVEDADGKYDLPPPPPTYEVCSSYHATYGAYLDNGAKDKQGEVDEANAETKKLAESLKSMDLVKTSNEQRINSLTEEKTARQWWIIAMGCSIAVLIGSNVVSYVMFSKRKSTDQARSRSVSETEMARLGESRA